MKRIISTLLVMTVLIGTLSLSLTYAAIETQPHSKVTEYQRTLKLEEMTQKEVLSIDYSDIYSIRDIARDIVDSGTMIYISNPKISIEELSNLLSIPLNCDTTYQELLLVAYSIYKIDEQYVFSNHYATTATENTRKSSLSKDLNISENEEIVTASENTGFEKVVLTNNSSKKTKELVSLVDCKDVLSTAISARKDVEQSSKMVYSDDNIQSAMSVQPKSVTLPSASPSATWNSTLNVYGKDNKKYGYINCTVYAYAKGTGKVNGTNKKIYDVVGSVKAYPNKGYKVSKYITQLRCNFTDFNNLQTTTLPSGISYSDGISLSGSYGSTGGSGSISYTTSWSYNPESQKITESSSSARIVKWTAKPVSPSSGKAYDITPGMRIACPTNKKRQVRMKVFCNAMILGITINANELEIGSSF